MSHWLSYTWNNSVLREGDCFIDAKAHKHWVVVWASNGSYQAREIKYEPLLHVWLYKLSRWAMLDVHLSAITRQ